MADSFLNAVIYVVSKSELGYEGTLVDVNAAEATLTIANVRCKGTEGRQPGNEIAGADEVFPMIVFAGSDVKNLTIVSMPPAAPAAPAPPVAPPPLVAPPPVQQQQRSVFDQPVGGGDGVAAITIYGLAPGTRNAQVAELFQDPSSILSIRILALPASASQQHQGKYAADVVFPSHEATRRALAGFNNPNNELQIEFLNARQQQPQYFQPATTRSFFDSGARGRGRGGAFAQEARKKNAETFGSMAFSHRGGNGYRGRGGRGGNRGGRGGGRGNAET